MKPPTSAAAQEWFHLGGSTCFNMFQPTNEPLSQTWHENKHCCGMPDEQLSEVPSTQKAKFMMSKGLVAPGFSTFFFDVSVPLEYAVFCFKAIYLALKTLTQDLNATVSEILSLMADGPAVWYSFLACPWTAQWPLRPFIYFPCKKTRGMLHAILLGLWQLARLLLLLQLLGTSLLLVDESRRKGPGVNMGKLGHRLSVVKCI